MLETAARAMWAGIQDLEMKLRELIIAVVVLAALSGALYWSSHHQQSEKSAVSPAGGPTAVLKLNQGSIDKVSLAQSGAAVTLVKDATGKWEISAPEAFAADQDAVSGVLSTLSSLNADRVVDEKATDFGQYGLDDRAVTATIETTDHKERKLLIGDETPAGGDVYAMVAGEPKVFTIASYNKTGIDKDADDLRDKRLVTMEPDKVSGVRLKRKGQTVEFGRIKDGWQITKPKPLRADNSAVGELVRSVADARMNLSGTGSDEAARGFAKATEVANVTLTGDKGTQTLDVRKNKDEVFVKSSAVEGTYKADASLGTAVDKGLDDFENKKLFDFGFEEPNKIELHDGAKAWYLVRSGDDWWQNGKKMDAASVEGLVEGLRDLAATGIPDAGFKRADIEVVVTSGDGKRVERVEISKAGDKCVARREGDPELYELTARAVSDLETTVNGVKAAGK